MAPSSLEFPDPMKRGLRSVSYLFIMAATVMYVMFFCAGLPELGKEWFREHALGHHLLKDTDWTWATGYFTWLFWPFPLAASLCYLFLYRQSVPVSYWSWIGKFFERRKMKMDGAVNQKGIGQINVDIVSFWVLTVPSVIFMCMVMRDLYKSERAQKAIDEGEENIAHWRMERFALYAGFAATYMWVIFFIPVARHSVITQALGWSPVDALRFHVWAGFGSAFWLAVHGLGFLVVWIIKDESIWSQVWPHPDCWQLWYDEGEWRASEHHCSFSWFSLTGIIVGFFVLILTVSSLNRFRRRNYALFWKMHVVFGSLSVVMAILHWSFIASWMIPSLVYYMASTSPTMVQAVASYYQGGVCITKVRELADAAGCTEITMALTDLSRKMLETQPGFFCKMCVPKLSLVWHPFTVYQQPNDPTTVRILFRPVGRFTEALKSSLTNIPRAPVVIDGFYANPDRVGQAMQHDHVSIVAGGVAITPFLSMLDHVAKAITSQSHPDGCLKSLHFHWVCREEGLCNYIMKNHFAPACHKFAQVSGDFSFKIHIHHTSNTYKSSKSIVSFADSSTKHSNSDNDFSDSSKEQRETSSEESNGDEKPLEVSNDGSCSHESQEKFINDDKSTPTGHLMEEYVFKAGRYNAILRNIPAAFVFCFIVWTSGILLFRQGRVYRALTRALHKELYTFLTLMVWLISVILISIFFVAFYMHVRNRPVPVAPVVIDKEEAIDECDLAILDDFIQHHVGRPTDEIIFACPSLASRPAFFTCGPVPMVDAVKKRADSEKSVLQKRYVIYNEEFEM